MAEPLAELGIGVKVYGGNDLDKLNSQLQATTINAQKLQGAVDKGLGSSFASEAAQTASATVKIGSATTATTQSMTTFQRAMQFVRGLFGPYSSEADKSVSATRAFREALHTVNPVLLTAGTNLTGLSHFAGLARAGILGLAAGISGAVLVSLQVFAENLDTVRKRLESLYGTQGGEVFGAVKQSAENTKTSIASTADAIDNYMRAYDNLRHAPPIGEKITQKPSVIIAYENGLAEFKTVMTEYREQIDELSQHVGPTLGLGVPGGSVIRGVGVPASAMGSDETLRNAVAARQTLVNLQKELDITGSEAAKNVSDFFATIDREGKISADVYEKMTQVGNPLRAVAGALADIFGKGETQVERMNELTRQLRDHVDEYGQTWKARVMDIDDVNAAIARLKQQGKGLGASVDTETLKQKIDDLKTSFEEFWTTLGSTRGTTAFSGLTDMLNGMMDSWTERLRVGKGLFDTFLTPPQGWTAAANQALDLLIGKFEIAISKKNELLYGERGGAIGATIGAFVGAIGGGMIAGPPGAVVGGVAGFGLGGSIGGTIGRRLGQAMDDLEQQSSEAAPPVNALATDIDTTATAASRAASSVGSLTSTVDALANYAESSLAKIDSLINQVPGMAAAGSAGYFPGSNAEPSFQVPAGGVNLGGGGGSGGEPGYGLPASWAGYATGGGFTVRDSQPVNFMATAGERVTIAPPGSGASSFVVAGPSGIDRVPVGFSAPTGTVVTIAPKDSAGGYPAFGKVTFAAGHPPTATSASASATASTATAAQTAQDRAQSMLEMLMQSGIRVPPAIQAMLTMSAGGGSPFDAMIQSAMFRAQHGGAMLAEGSVGFHGNPNWSYGNFQGGGKFVVSGGKTIGNTGGDVHVHVYGVANPAAFIASESQIKRAAKRALMQ